eukprot:CAMPEP_0113595194 /NCGR_PEP_ID=MMETSP0015_2-20120614/39513_1 /TAXON_ID=2838 /ORGANISM="Odontella" /LENGTH=42 /DNA_ID=CAMNT_0000502307 /DNA_START=30 /DNA_END=155 /DNA_ORIENTATION=- /assembly_acc=CAM_ASM_000160
MAKLREMQCFFPSPNCGAGKDSSSSENVAAATTATTATTAGG